MNDFDRNAKYWPALDGLRGIAVLAVVVFHAGATWLQGGFLGVDVFFVLSGFLITGQLLAEQRNFGRISLGRFFVRRAVRLQPALYVLLTGYLFAWAMGWVPASALSAAREVFVAAVGLANWARAYEVWMPDFLGHTWSLAIEEQFYLIWAFFLAWYWGGRREVDRQTFAISLVFSVASIATMYFVHINGVSASRAYNGLDTRAFALLLGAALAGYCSVPACQNQNSNLKNPPNFKWALVIALCSIAGLFYFARWTVSIMYPWGYLLTALLTGVVIWRVVSDEQTSAKWFLEQSWLVYVGKVSYGYYLWHSPILRVAGYKAADLGISHITSQIFGVFLSFLIALASYYLVEIPVRRAYMRSRLHQPT